MNIYVPLYRLISSDENRDNIKIIIDNCIRDSQYLYKFSEKIEYKFGKRTSQYADDIYSAYISDVKIGVFILDILYKFILENLDKTNKVKEYNWFEDFIDIDSKNNYKNQVFIHRDEYKKLINLRENYKVMVDQSKNKYKYDEIEYRSKLVDLNKENKLINDKYIKEKNKYNELKSKINVISGEKYFFGKDVLIICETLNSISKEALLYIKSYYKLRKLEIESSIKITPKLKDKVKNSDIVILSVTQAKHSIDKLASANPNYYRSNKNNLHLIMRDISESIGAKIIEGDL